jgi:hypothetical protein
MIDEEKLMNEVVPTVSREKKFDNRMRLEKIDSVKKLRHIVEQLYTLLDDIDTLSDMIKPSDIQEYKLFYTAAIKKAESRHMYIETDGYNLFAKKDFIKSLKNVD